jgi:mono/diheme cytochrome c family protein
MKVIRLFGSLFLWSFLAACDPGDCPEDSAVVWADVEPLFSDHCVGCHSSSLSGEQRSEAPEEYNYDTVEAARAHPNWTWAEVMLGHMPPSGALAESAQQSIREWLACGGPE